jgi:hypothetical protein
MPESAGHLFRIIPRAAHKTTPFCTRIAEVPSRIRDVADEVFCLRHPATLPRTGPEDKELAMSALTSKPGCPVSGGHISFRC